MIVAINHRSLQVCGERRTVKSINATFRADSEKAKSVVTDIFKGLPPAAMRSYLTFLYDSIKFLSLDYGDRWGITLFKNRIWLNVGRVGVLALHHDELRVLVESKVAPSGTTFRKKKTYLTAPGCRKANVPLSRIQTHLRELFEAHCGAMSIAAKRNMHPVIREAHSSGVIEYLSEFVHMPVPGPSYQRDGRHDGSSRKVHHAVGQKQRIGSEREEIGYCTWSLYSTSRRGWNDGGRLSRSLSLPTS